MFLSKSLAVATVVTALAGSAGVASAQGTLIWATPAEVDAIDPQAMGGWLGRSVTRQIYEGLIDENLSDAKATSVALRPALASSWDVTDGGKVWTFHLRSGVHFQDGTPFDAAAVKFNFDRILDPKSPQFSIKANSTLVEFISWIDKVETPDNQTVRVTLKGPNYDWFQNGLQTSGTFLIISPAALRKYGNDGISLHPVGTGPFRFVERQQGVKIILARNEDYWGTHAKLDTIAIVPIPDPETRVNALLSNEVNMITVPPWDELETLKKAGYVLLTNPNVPSLTYISLNTRDPILKDVRVRQAINFALDREGLTREVTHGTTTPAYSMFSRGTYAFDPEAKAYPYDPARARALLAAAGYPNGFSTSFYLPEYGTGELWEQWFQRDLARVGIKVSLHKSEWVSYMHAYGKGLTPGLGMHEMLWGESIPSWTGTITACDRQPPKGSNTGWYCNPAVDALFHAAVAEPDRAKATALYRQADALITRDAAYVPVLNDEQPVFLSPSVHGFVDPAEDWFDFSTVSVGP